jgi:hypothetical protein
MRRWLGRVYRQQYTLTETVQFFVPLLECHITSDQRWAKGPIDRSSDTDSIFRLYRSMSSSDFFFSAV